MDVFERVREVNADTSLTEDRIIRARARLSEGITARLGGDRKRIRMSPLLLIAGSVTGVAAATAGVVVIGQLNSIAPQVDANPVEAPDPSVRPPGDVLKPTPTPTPVRATAADVLQTAANAAAGFVGPQLEPGQFIRRESTAEEIILYGQDGAGAWGMGGSHHTATSAWRLGSTSVVYVPEDLAAPWYFMSSDHQVVDIFGNQQQAAEQSQRYLENYGGETPLEAFTRYAPWDGSGEMETLDIFFARLPRDPHELIDWARAFVGTDVEGWVDGKMGWFFIDMLAYNVGPADLRAAMYRALSLLPGSTVSDEVNGVRTVTFDSELATGDSTEPSLRRMTISIEMSTGAVLEVSDRAEAGIGVVPADVPDFRVRHVTTVVDSLPAE